VRINNTTAGKIGLLLALVHFGAFALLAISIQRSGDPQAALLWGVFAVIDFPLSLFYFFAESVASSSLFHRGPPWFAQLLYFPYLIHGLLGTIWWYFLPRLVTPRKMGGVW
jgi:hypothetical protein